MLKPQHYDVMSVSLSIFITTDDTQQSSTLVKTKPAGKDSSSKWSTCSAINNKHHRSANNTRS